MRPSTTDYSTEPLNSTIYDFPRTYPELSTKLTQRTIVETVTVIGVASATIIVSVFDNVTIVIVVTDTVDIFIVGTAFDINIELSSEQSLLREALPQRRTHVSRS